MRESETLKYPAGEPAPSEGEALTIFRIEGMCCADEGSALERRLRGLPGVNDLQTNLLDATVRIRHDPACVSETDLVRAIAGTGMRARRIEARIAARAPWWRNRRLLSTAGGGALLALGFWLSPTDPPPARIVPILLASMALSSVYIAPRALLAVRHLRLDMNFLMVVAAIGAAAIGEWLEGSTVIFLFAVAQLLESYSLDRARQAIRKLMQLSPTEALVRRHGIEMMVPVEEIRLGEVIIARPGDRIPLDGTILRGTSTVNEAPITGESLPTEKSPGAPVYAGSINLHGALEIAVTHLAGDTMLARIIHMVEEAQAQRAPAQAFVERFARIYTPTVIGAAVLVMLVPPLFLGKPFEPWFYRGLVLLVISCPCALVISTPVSVVSALASAARQGILIKGGTYLERIGTVKAVAFDKTGTLTLGRPAVTDVIPLNDHAPEEILRLAAGLEARSEHPLAQAIRTAAEACGLPVSPPDDFQALPGRGAVGLVDGQPCWIGNHRLVEERGLCTPALEARLAGCERDGKTTVVVGTDGKLLGIVALADGVREASRSAITALRAGGIAHTVMLTGDNDDTARAIAARVGVDEVRAGLLPEDKVAAVRDLRRRFGRVAMVGDGVNDAPALAAADIGIAMGAAGTDVALETADIALMGDDLSRLPLAFRLSRRALRIIQTNIALSLLTKAVFIGLTAAGEATLWMAVAADMGTSLLVIVNGLRLLRAR